MFSISEDQWRTFTITAEQTKSIFPLDVSTNHINELRVIVKIMLKSKIDNVVSLDDKIKVIFR